LRAREVDRCTNGAEESGAACEGGGLPKKNKKSYKNDAALLYPAPHRPDPDGGDQGQGLLVLQPLSFLKPIGIERMAKYTILAQPAVADLLREMNAADEYVVYGGLQFLNNQFVQIMVKKDNDVDEQTAELVWGYFKDSNVMIKLPNEDTAENLMRGAEESVVEALEGAI